MYVSRYWNTNSLKACTSDQTELNSLRTLSELTFDSICRDGIRVVGYRLLCLYNLFLLVMIIIMLGKGLVWLISAVVCRSFFFVWVSACTSLLVDLSIVRKWRLGLFGHVDDVSANQIFQTYCKSQDGVEPFSDWRCAQSRPPTTWIQQICRDAGIVLVTNHMAGCYLWLNATHHDDDDDDKCYK